jgi:hypothetical protein
MYFSVHMTHSVEPNLKCRLKPVVSDEDVISQLSWHFTTPTITSAKHVYVTNNILFELK